MKVLQFFLAVSSLVTTTIAVLHLAPPGSHTCDYGSPVSKAECEEAGRSLRPNPKRTLQVGSGGKCLDGGWGQVPLGCSVQTGGDGAACYKSSGNTGKGCIHNMYQLVCGAGNLHLAPPGSHVCDYGISVPIGECEAAALNFWHKPGRSLVVRWPGQNGGKCLDGGWGQVPLGCSIQTGGDGAAVYKHTGDTGKGCISHIYRLVCKDYN